MSKKSQEGRLEITQQTIKFLDTMLRAWIDGIVITDAKKNIIVANEGFCAFFGRHWCEVVGTSLSVWLEQFDAGTLKHWAELEKSVHLKGVCYGVELQMTKREGVKHFSINAFLLKRLADEELDVIISI